MKKKMRVLRNLLAVVILLAILLPVGIVMAESFGTNSTVLLDAGEVIGDNYQRHTFIAEGRHWVFYNTDDAIWYTSSVDATTWAAPTKFDDYYCNMSALFCCNGSAFSLWYDEPANYLDIAWMNITGPGESIYYVMGNPASNGSILWRTRFEAVPGDVGLTYSHPSICDNTDDYPFIAYMVYNGSAYSANLSADISNTGLWGSATNSTISSSLTFNISRDVLYPSVIPVSADNVSIMVVFNTGLVFTLAQNYANYDVGTDLWTYPAVAQLPLPATSYIDVDDLMYHSEVNWAGNLTNVDDVFAVATANDSFLGKYYWADHYGDPAAQWSSDVAFPGYFSGSLGIRNALGDQTVTAIEMTSKVDLYNNDFDMTSLTWSGMNLIDGVDATSVDRTETDYDNAATAYLGAIYYDNDVAFIPDLEYGCYGCTAPVAPSTVPTSVTMMAWIVVLVFGALICIILLAYGASEAIKGGGTEFLKVGLIGLITLIIAATIVAALL